MLSNHPNCLGGNGPSASSDLIGDVDGPASATDNAVARFDGTTGKLIQNSVVTIADSTGAIAGAQSLTAPASNDLTLAGGSSGASLVLGQGATAGSVTLTPTGTGITTSAKNAHFGTAGFGILVGDASTTLPTDATRSFIVATSGNVSGYPNGSLVYANRYNDPTSRHTWLVGNSGATALVEAMRLNSGSGNLLIGGTTDITGSGGLKVFGTTAATSSITGSGIFGGGIGVAGSVVAGGTNNGTNEYSYPFLSSATTLGGFATYSSGATVNQRIWAIQHGAASGDGVWRLRALNDALSNGSNAISITRTAEAIGTISLGTTTAIVSVLGTTAGASNAGALVVAGGISAGNTGAASYFGGAVTIGGSANLSIQSGAGLFLDGGSNTYIVENSADSVQVKAGGLTALTTTSALTTVNGNLAVSGTGTSTFAGAGTFGGRLAINAASVGYAGVYLGGILPNLSGDTNGVGYFQGGTFPASYAVGAHSFYSAPASTASVYTLTNMSGFYAAAPTKGAGSTITNLYGVYVEALTQGTNNYAFRSAGAGVVSIGDAAASSSAVTGALQVAGGIGVGAASYFGGALNVAGAITSTSTGFNSLSGELAIASTKKLYLDGGGDTYIQESASNVLDFYAGAGNSLKLTATTATFAGAVTIGNTVNTVSPTSPNRTVTMVVNGVTLYLAAKTTND